jgi:hypothetical protein
MFKVTSQQMQQVKASLNESIAVQQVLFDTIGFTPADDPGEPYYSRVMSKEEFDQYWNEIVGSPYDFAICDEERASEIQGGATLTEEEECAVLDHMFAYQDEHLCFNEFSDEVDTLICANVTHCVENESVAIKEFLGFFQSVTDAVAALHTFDYELYGEGL